MRPQLRTVLMSASLTLTIMGSVGLRQAPAAVALNPLKPVCGVTGLISGIVGKACKVVQSSGRVVTAGKKLLTGHVGGAVKALLGGGSSSSGIAGKAAFVVGLAAVGGWVLGGARTALKLTASLLDKTTRPQLRTTWFSSTYWRIAGIGALLTLPFLFAAAIQALLRSDLTLLLRAAFGYLPLSLLAVSIAAPLTMLLLAASDGISTIVASAAGGASTRFLAQLGLVSGTLSLISRSPFVSFFIGLLVVGAAVLLWVEMLMRDAAIYIVVLMVPLVFASFVWPARRVWAIRAIEVLIGLILSKFAIVSVLSLGGAALGQTGNGGAGGMLMGLVLVTLAALAPWALVRLLPMTELASAAAGQLRADAGQLRAGHERVDARASGASDWLNSVPAGMRRQADQSAEVAAGGDGPRSETEKLDGARAARRGASETSPSAVSGGELDVHGAAASRDSDTASSGRDAGAAEAPGGGASSATGPPGYDLAADADSPPGQRPDQRTSFLSGTPSIGLEALPPTRRPGPSGSAGVAEDHNPIPPGQESQDGPL
jgi:hypothetical protein